MSRSPVHHALTRLVSEGLLIVKARRGYYVTPVTAQALVEGYEVRLALELHAADVAVDTASDEQVGELRRRLAATEEAISHEEWDAANAAFHETQVDLAGNALLSRFYRELSVNLMMQVIRAGGSSATSTWSPSTRRSSTASRPATARRRARRSRVTSSRGAGSPSTRSSAPAARSSLFARRDSAGAESRGLIPAFAGADP